jgi:hypothetical protein
MAEEPLLTKRRTRSPGSQRPPEAGDGDGRRAAGRTSSERLRAIAIGAIAIVVGAWLVFVVRQIADAGFYSDDWALQWEWDNFGFSGAIDRQFDFLGSKPLLAYLLIGSYEVLGTDPAVHHLVAALLTLGCAVGFYFVLRGLRFPPRDAIPVASLALLFPWASSVRLWPTAALNNFAVLLLIAGFLIALRGLRVKGPRGLLIHLAATACYVASILVYEVTTGLALFAWIAYVWLGGWRAAGPRMAMDIPAVAAAALYTREHTNKHVESIGEQLNHVLDIARQGADVITAALVPVAIPADISDWLTAIVMGGSLAVLIAAALRSRRRAPAKQSPGIRWPLVAALAVAALALSWAIFVPQAFYTPTFRGIEDRVNIVALYPAAVLVWAVLRAGGSLFRRNGYQIAVAGAIAVGIGYWIQDFRQQDDWLRSTELQPGVLAAVERANPHEGAVVLVFGYPAETARGVPVLNTNYDLKPAARLVTSKQIDAYPVFAGSTLRCSPKGIAIDYLATPLYQRISVTEEGTAKLQPYSNVIFVDVAGGRHEVIRSREQCLRAVAAYPPGPWLDRSSG